MRATARERKRRAGYIIIWRKFEKGKKDRGEMGRSEWNVRNGEKRDEVRKKRLYEVT